MHKIGKSTKGDWRVRYQYQTNLWDTVAICSTAEAAAAICSWLNGGRQPATHVLETVTWIGE